jgi:hypothetical protein
LQGTPRPAKHLLLVVNGFEAAWTSSSAQPKLAPHLIEILIQMSVSVSASLAKLILGAYLGRFYAVTIAIR